VEVAGRRVGHEVVQPAEALGDLVEHRAELVQVLDVGLKRDRLGGTACLELGQRRARGLLVAPVVDDRDGAALGQRKGERAADPP
jgi:hypothetical protein